MFDPSPEARENGWCGACCEHGGYCELEIGHDGPHDTGYCQFNDLASITPDEALERMREKTPLGWLYAR